MQESDIIKRIDELCKTRSWTTYRLAKESGITYSTLCTLLHKTNAPSFATLAKICDGLGITLAQFFDTANEPALLTAEQKEIVALWNSLSEENQKAANQYLQFLNAQQASQQ